MNVKKLFSVLLIAVLLMNPVALMEEVIEQRAELNENAAIDGIIEEVMADEENVAESDVEQSEPESEVLPEPVDEIVAEETEAELNVELSAEAMDVQFTLDEAFGAQESEQESAQELEAEKVTTSELYMAASSNIAVDAINFPDQWFRQLVSDNIDTNPKDGYLSANEIANVTDIGVPWRYTKGYVSIESLKGIEYFTELEELYCGDCALTTLDVSKNTKLKVLDCESNYLTQLNVSGCPNLRDICCLENPMTTLDISNCPVLCTALKGNIFKDEVGIKTYINPYTGATLECDATLTIITDANTSVDSTATDATPSMVTIPVPKNTKSTVNLGTTCQIDLGGKTGNKYRSSKKKVATVDANGVITTRGAGRTKITFKVGRRSRYLILIVVDPTVPTSISLNMSGTNAVKTGDSVTLTVVLPEGTNSGIKWKSSNKRVATVKNGVVTFKKAGKVTITAITSRGKKKAQVKFKVNEYDAKKDLANYEYRTVQERGRGRLVFQKSPKAKAAFMRKHYFHTGDQILVNVNWRKNGFAIAYHKGTYGYVNASYIDW